MKRYIMSRLIQGVVVLFAASLLVFVLVRLTGSPVYLMLPIEATQQDLERANREMGLDKPVYVQYAVFAVNMLRGNFGNSIRTKHPVGDLLGERFMNSLQLGGMSLVFALIIGLPLGVLAAVKRGAFDALARGIALFGQSVPSFWLAIMLVAVFAGWQKMLPAAGIGGLQYYVLPVFTLTVTGFLLSGVIRFQRSGMLEVLNADYIKLVRAKGLPESVVIWKHALKNASIPMVTFLGFYVALLFGGATLVVETVFAWPGVGLLLYQSILARDFPVVQAVTIIFVGGFVVVNIFIDILYAYLDPRIRYQ